MLSGLPCFTEFKLQSCLGSGKFDICWYIGLASALDLFVVLSPGALGRSDALLEGLWDLVNMWEFPKIRGTVFWGPYNKDPTI